MPKSASPSSKSPQGKKGRGCLKGCLTAVVLFFAFIIGSMIYVSRDWRSDEQVLKTYQPTAEIADIAEKNTLTDHGKATFYRTNPRFVDGETFRKYCFANGVEALGCTTGFKIYLLQIDDPKFADHKYAVSVHEMLHIAYRRLGAEEKKRLNTLLEQEFQRHQDDSYLLEVENKLKSRKNSSSQDILSEFHSKFGVEQLNLSPELEQYYNQYFNDRQKVVELFKKGGFNSRARRLEELSYETKSLAPQLVSMEQQLTAYQNAGDKANFDKLVGQYNSLVSQYNSKAAESQRIFSEVEKFYQYFNPDYKPPQETK